MPLRPVNRDQGWLVPLTFDELLPQDHPALSPASLHQLGIFVCKVHTSKPLLSEMLHDAVDVLPHNLRLMGFLWEPWWRRVIAPPSFCASNSLNAWCEINMSPTQQVSKSQPRPAQDAEVVQGNLCGQASLEPTVCGDALDGLLAPFFQPLPTSSLRHNRITVMKLLSHTLSRSCG